MSDTKVVSSGAELVATEFPIRYRDPVYQETHRKLFHESILTPLKETLPPGISQAVLDQAFVELEEALGKANVFRGKALEDYIDPYELDEAAGKRKIPSGAIT